MSYARISLAVSLMAGALVCWVSVSLYPREGRADTVSATTQSSPPRDAAVLDLQYGPLSTFQQSCARCHGPEGAFFGATFADREDDKVLQMVTVMMRGPGGLKPTEADTMAMAAYLHAIRAKEPFVVITNAAAHAAGRDAVLRGEASEEAAIEVRKDGRAVPVTRIPGAVWSLDAPPTPPFDIVARRRGVESVFAFPARQWSDPGPPKLKAQGQDSH
jgi:hypothetical protein